MKLITTILISLIFILPCKAMQNFNTMGGFNPVPLIAVGAVETILIIYGTSTAINNIGYLSYIEDHPNIVKDHPSKVIGYIVGGLNITAGIVIFDQSHGESWKAFGIGQIVLGTIDIVTTVLVSTKSKQRQLTYAPTILIDSNKKPVMGFNIRLAIN